METLLTVSDLRKTHGHTRALKGVTFEIARGEIVGVVGENGAGKSTLVSILGGWTTADAGTMTLDSEPYRPQTPEEALACGVGSIQQRFEVNPDHTIAQNIYRASFHATKAPEEQRALAAELMASLGIEFDPDRRMGDLVRPEQALIEVVRLMAEETQLVLMDEVAATFNDHEIAQFHEITRRLAREGRSVIYITHRIDEISTLTGRVLVLRDGEVARDFEPRAMPAADIAFEITQRELTFGGRPDTLETADTRLYVEGLSTDDGTVVDVTLAVQKGEIFGLTGLRRAGMSELASALVGVRPASWRVLHKDGRDITLTEPADAIASSIGYLSDRDDELGLETESSIADNLASAAAANSFEAELAARREVVAHVQRLRIRTLDIQGEVGHLSAGNQQKIALARWMSAGCDVLILNHPTRGIDVGARQDISRMLVDLAATGTSIILISSDMSELVELCHRIGVMRDGRLVGLHANDETDEDQLMMEALGGEAFEFAERRR